VKTGRRVGLEAGGFEARAVEDLLTRGHRHPNRVSDIDAGLKAGEASSVQRPEADGITRLRLGCYRAERGMGEGNDQDPEPPIHKALPPCVIKECVTRTA
jgi:hypothetical protein